MTETYYRVTNPGAVPVKHYYDSVPYEVPPASEAPEGLLLPEVVAQHLQSHLPVLVLEPVQLQAKRKGPKRTCPFCAFRTDDLEELLKHVATHVPTPDAAKSDAAKPPKD